MGCLVPCDGRTPLNRWVVLKLTTALAIAFGCGTQAVGIYDLRFDGGAGIVEGNSRTFAYLLEDEIFDDVSVVLSSSDFSFTATTKTWTTANWKTSTLVTIATAIDDGIATGFSPRIGTVLCTFTNATLDPYYAALGQLEFSYTIWDIDTRECAWCRMYCLCDERHVLSCSHARVDAIPGLVPSHSKRR